jgi:hypothetical protein
LPKFRDFVSSPTSSDYDGETLDKSSSEIDCLDSAGEFSKAFFSMSDI